VAAAAGAVLVAVVSGIATAWVGRIPFVNPPAEATVAPISTVASGARLPFTVASEISRADCETDLFTAKPPRDIDFSKPLRKPPELAGSDAPYGWGWKVFPAADGAPNASPASVYVTVQGTTTTAVVLRSIDIRVVQRRIAPAGTILHNDCGGNITYRWLAVDLDKNPPHVNAVLDKSMVDVLPPASPKNREPIRFPYTVSSTDPEVFEIRATTVNCDCDWIAEMSWTSGGDSGVVTIRDGGKPFRTVGRANATAQCNGLGKECGAPTK
jgi:hypothetical protein